ncbi:hypothetical protein D3C81_615430 [compost metagenome]
MAAPVAQAVGLYTQGPSRGGGVGVVKQAGLQINGAIADDAAAGALQGDRRDGQGAAPRMLDLAARIRQGGRAQGQIIAINGDAPVAVVQLACLDDGVARARLYQCALGIVQITHVQIELAGLQSTFRIVQGGIAHDVELTWRRNHRLVRADIALCCRQADVGGTGLAA